MMRDGGACCHLPVLMGGGLGFTPGLCIRVASARGGKQTVYCVVNKTGGGRARRRCVLPATPHKPYLQVAARHTHTITARGAAARVKVKPLHACLREKESESTLLLLNINCIALCHENIYIEFKVLHLHLLSYTLGYIPIIRYTVYMCVCVCTGVCMSYFQ